MTSKVTINHHVEPVEQVLFRMVSFLRSIENQFSKQSVLVISHGDCLQISLVWFQGYEAHHHRKMVPIQTANMCSLNNVRTLEEIQQLVSMAQDHAA